MKEKIVHNPKLPYEIVLPKMNGEHLWSMQQWCLAQFGVQWNAVSRDPAERSGRWTVLWCGPSDNKSYRWHFKNEQDAVVFTLRWS